MEKWRFVNEIDATADNARTTVVVEHYTLLLRAASYFIDAATRDRLLEARREGGGSVSFRPAIECYGCAAKHTVTISPIDVLGFIAHDETEAAISHANIIPFRQVH